MSSIYFIFFIVLFVLYIKQKNRIDEIEKRISSSLASTKINNEPLENIIPKQEIESKILVPNITKTETKIKEENSGRILGKMGIGAVFLSVTFFIKYAFDNNWVGPAGRIAIGIIIGLLILSIGQYLRKKYFNFSNILMGGGVAILYFSIYAMNSFYNLADPFIIAVLLFIVTVIAFVLSILNNNIILSIIAVLGGFVTPFLTGSHGNNMLEIFGYVTLLNLLILGISFYKKWPDLVSIAILGSAVNFFVWFQKFYDVKDISATVLFLVITFAIFLIASVYKIISTKEEANQADYFNILSNAIITGVFMYFILHKEFHYITGSVAILIGFVYVVVSFVINKYNFEDKNLNIVLPGIAVFFITVAVPLQFSGLWITVLWFTISCILYIVATLIKNRGFQIMGVIVYSLGIINYFQDRVYNQKVENFVAVFNPAFMTILLGIIFAYFIAYIYKNHSNQNEIVQRNGIVYFIIIANVLTIYAFSSQVVFYNNVQKNKLETAYYRQTEQIRNDQEIANNHLYQEHSKNIEIIKNRSNTSVSVIWAIYAALLTAIGFALRISFVRKMGLILFVFTAIKVVIDVWNLGPIYRIISFIVFGILTLVASFVYSKYKDRLIEVIK